MGLVRCCEVDSLRTQLGLGPNNSVFLKQRCEREYLDILLEQVLVLPMFMYICFNACMVYSMDYVCNDKVQI